MAASAPQRQTGGGDSPSASCPEGLHWTCTICSCVQGGEGRLEPPVVVVVAPRLHLTPPCPCLLTMLMWRPGHLCDFSLTCHFPGVTAGGRQDSRIQPRPSLSYKSSPHPMDLGTLTPLAMDPDPCLGWAAAPPRCFRALGDAEVQVTGWERGSKPPGWVLQAGKPVVQHQKLSEAQPQQPLAVGTGPSLCGSSHNPTTSPLGSGGQGK